MKKSEFENKLKERFGVDFKVLSPVTTLEWVNTPEHILIPQEVKEFGDSLLKLDPLEFDSDEEIGVCDKCYSMTWHRQGKCLKCKKNEKI